jgi:hypothetical protein
MYMTNINNNRSNLIFFGDFSAKYDCCKDVGASAFSSARIRAIYIHNYIRCPNMTGCIAHVAMSELLSLVM